jgi:glycosyltransferase involved in cell wall biosynthesis
VRRIERFLARRADAVITVSDPIADELVRTLGLRSRPTLVRNCAELRVVAAKDPAPGPLRVIYQASFGVARFPEDVLDAAAGTQDVEFTLRIAGLDPAALREAVAARGLESCVHIAEAVQPAELVAALDDFDVGLVIDRPITLNVAYALPNKLFEYLMAGLAVVVPALPAMGRLVEEREVGLTFEPGSPKSLADSLQRLADDRALLSRLQERAAAAAHDDLNAEHELAKTVALWEGLLGDGPQRRGAASSS